VRHAAKTTDGKIEAEIARPIARALIKPGLKLIGHLPIGAVSVMTISPFSTDTFTLAT
jgi:hypothetical protein